MNRNKEPIEKPITPELKRKIILYFLFATIFCSTFVFFAVMSRTQQKMASELNKQGISKKSEILKKEVE